MLPRRYMWQSGNIMVARGHRVGCGLPGMAGTFDAVRPGVAVAMHRHSRHKGSTKGIRYHAGV
jgi:hypothetical protein